MPTFGSASRAHRHLGATDRAAAVATCIALFFSSAALAVPPPNPSLHVKEQFCLPVDLEGTAVNTTVSWEHAMPMAGDFIGLFCPESPVYV